MKFLFLIVFIFISCESSNNKTFDINVPAYTKSKRYIPNLNTSWHWQLQGNINTSYDVDLYDIDLFDSSSKFIKNLHSQGKKVICYFSAGTYEKYRIDKNDFAKHILGKIMEDWDDEKWLDIRSVSLIPIMRARLDLAVKKGCDGVELDNLDAYINNSGFNLSYNDQLAYNKFLANESRKRGLSVGLKNDLDQIKDLIEYFDFAVNEQCFEYNECEYLKIFIDKKKAVFNAEYLEKYKLNTKEQNVLCIKAKKFKFNTLILDIDLNDKYRFSCN